MAKRRKKRSRSLLYTLLILLTAGLVVLIVFMLGGGYDVYVKSTYKLQYYDTVSQACADFDVDEALAYAIIRTESKFDPEAHSSADARGLMQITQITLDWVQLRSDEFDHLTIDDMYDPATNIRCGVYVLSLLEEQFADEDTVVAAYNAGIGIVGEWLANPDYSHDGVTLHTIPYDETAAYVERVRSSKAIYKDYYQLGGPEKPNETDEPVFMEPRYIEEVSAACADFGVDKSLAFAVICAESKFNPNAVSRVDARGLMQITDTGLDWAKIRSDEFDTLTIDDMFDPENNIRCGVFILSLLKEQFSDDLTVAAAYNAGVGIVNEWLADSAYSQDGVTLYRIPFDETSKYVFRIRLLKALYAQMI